MVIACAMLAVTVSCGSAPPAATTTLTTAPTAGAAPTAALSPLSETTAAPTTATPTASPQGSAAVPTVEVTPQAALLTSVGETRALTALARGPDGQVVQAEVSWRSSDPSVVSVDASGRVRAVTALGTALITAAVGGVESPPAYVTVAQPVPGAQLVDDSQFVAGPTAVDPAAQPAADNPYEVVLRGVASPAIGTILIGAGALPVAGRVVATEPAGSDVRVRLVVVPPTQLFTDFAFKDSADLSKGVFEIPAEIASGYDVQQAGATFTFTPKAAGVSPAPGIVLANMVREQPAAAQPVVTDGVAQGTRALPPLPPFSECTATIAFGSGLPVPLALTTPPSFTFTASGEALREATPQGTKITVRGTPTFKFTSVLEVRSAFEAKVECKATLVTRKFRVPGWAGLFFGGDVEFGVGFEVGGKVTLFAAKVGGTAEIKPTIEAVLDCPTGADCEFEGDVTAVTETAPVLEAPSLAQAQFEPSVSLFGFVSLEAGNADIQQLQFKAIEVKAGAELAAGLAPETLQMSNTSGDGRSKYALAFKGEVGPGIKLGDFLTFLGLGEVVPLKLSFEIPLGESPTGTVTADRARYFAGERATLTVALAAASTRFPTGGLYNVDRVVVVRKTGLVTTEVLAEQIATDGQTQFTLAFDAPALLNAEDLFAFVVTVLLPLDPPKLEIGAASGPSPAIVLEDVGRESEVEADANEDTTDSTEEFRDFTDLGMFNSGPVTTDSTPQSNGDRPMATGSADQTSSVILNAGGGLTVQMTSSVSARARNDLPIAGAGTGSSTLQVDFTVVDNPVSFTISREGLLSGSASGEVDRSISVHVGEFVFFQGCSTQLCEAPTGTLNFTGTLEPGRYRLQSSVFASAGSERNRRAQLESAASLTFTFTIPSPAAVAVRIP
jgi:hypothetical protein